MILLNINSLLETNATFSTRTELSFIYFSFSEYCISLKHWCIVPLVPIISPKFGTFFS